MDMAEIGKGNFHPFRNAYNIHNRGKLIHSLIYLNSAFEGLKMIRFFEGSSFTSQC